MTRENYQKIKLLTIVVILTKKRMKIIRDKSTTARSAASMGEERNMIRIDAGDETKALEVLKSGVCK